MQASLSPTALQSVLVALLAIVAAAWWLTVPVVMTSSTFIAIFGILTASAWVVKSTFENARPSSSLAQSLHDVEAAAGAKRTPRSSGPY